MDNKQFIDKWLIGYEDLEQKLEFSIEMDEDLNSISGMKVAKERSNFERLKGEYLGTLQGIIAWNIAPELSDKITGIINKLENE